MFKNWSNRDWIWLTSYFIFIIILLLANYYISWATSLSVVSSATSIALAIVAIFLSLKQDSENKLSSDSKHLDLTQQLRTMQTLFINKKNEIAEVVTNVEESMDTTNDVIQQESYTYEQLIAFGDKVKKETIQKFEKELNNQILNDIEKLKSESKNNLSYEKIKKDRISLIEHFIESVEDYNLPDVVAYLRNNGHDLPSTVVFRLLKEVERKRKL